MPSGGGAGSSSSAETRAGSPAAGTSERRWRVFHTKARQEKALAGALAAAGIEHYLPLMRSVKYYGHRKRVAELPLFSSYLFARGTVEEMYLAMSTDRVAHVIEVADQGTLEAELAQIRAAIDAGAVLTPLEFLEAGRRVRVREGPFKGIEGVVEEHRRADRLVLQIRTLGRAASMEIEAVLLEPVG